MLDILSSLMWRKTTVVTSCSRCVSRLFPSCNGEISFSVPTGNFGDILAGCAMSMWAVFQAPGFVCCTVFFWGLKYGTQFYTGIILNGLNWNHNLFLGFMELNLRWPTVKKLQQKDPCALGVQRVKFRLPARGSHEQGTCDVANVLSN